MNLQLDHFPMIKNNNNKPTPRCGRKERGLSLSSLSASTKTNKETPAARRAPPPLGARAFEHGFHNLSRWMTWLPISLKNAAKCDKWYQLQNHSITESLNANGAREKPYTAIPVHAVSLSVEQKPNSTKEPWLVRESNPSGGRVVTPNSTSTRRFMGNSFFVL